MFFNSLVMMTVTINDHLHQNVAITFAQAHCRFSAVAAQASGNLHSHTPFAWFSLVSITGQMPRP